MTTTLLAPAPAESACTMAAYADWCAPPPAPFQPCEFRVKWAHGDWEQRGAQALRRAVFCVEQGVFVGDDQDDIDAAAGTRTLVAVAMVGGAPEQVVGTVRIHPAEDTGTWWGSRLAVHAAFRHHGRIGATLIRLAVSSAHALGCTRFLAHVQSQNVPLFESLQWQVLGEERLHGRPHHRMQATLAAYPPCLAPYAGYVTASRRRT